MQAFSRFTRYPCLALIIASAAGCASTPRPPAPEDGSARQNAARALPVAPGTNALERPERDFDYAL